MQSLEKQNAIEYVEGMISKHSKMLLDNENLLSSPKMVNGSNLINAELVQKKIDDNTAILDNLYFIKNNLQDTLVIKTSIQNNQGVTTAAVNDTFFEEKSTTKDTKKSVKKLSGKKANTDKELLKKLYPEFPDNLLDELRYTEYDIVHNHVIQFIKTSNKEVDINEIIIDLYKTLNKIIKRDVIYGICSKIFRNGTVKKGSLPGYYKKK